LDYRNVEEDQAFWLWLQDLKKGEARPFIPDCPKSSLGRPGAKPVGEDEKDQQPVSTGLVLKAGETRVLRLPDAYFGVIREQPEGYQVGDRMVP
jgi:hypothetical protein